MRDEDRRVNAVRRASAGRRDGAKRSAQRTGSALRAVAVLSGAGFTMAGSVAIGALAGNWLDQRWGTAPWLLVVGFLLGAIGGFIQMARIIAIASR